MNSAIAPSSTPLFPWVNDVSDKFNLKINKRLTTRCLPVQSDYSGPFLYHQLSKADAPYVEEIMYHTPITEPMPPPWDFKFLPPEIEDDVVWDYKKEQRIVKVDFSKVDRINKVHKVLLSELMERDDITVIAEGVLPLKLLDVENLLEMLQDQMGNNHYPKFRQFDRVEEGNNVSYQERDGYVSMKVTDYVHYLTILMGPEPSTHPFAYEAMDGTLVELEKSTDSIFYMLDVSLSVHLSGLLSELKSNFKMKEILPGGEWCMLHHVGY